MAAAADSSKPAPDSTTFTQTFPTSAPALYVVFALRPDLTGNVACTMSANGVRLIQPLTINYGSNNSWGDFRVRSRGTFVKGDYRATLTYVPTRGGRFHQLHGQVTLVHGQVTLAASDQP